MFLCGGRKFAKVKPARDLDIYYDSTMCFSSTKDYIREMDKATAASATFVVRPYYDTMFSDIRPRSHLAVKLPDFVVPFPQGISVELERSSTPQVLGPRRPFFFKQPVQKPKPISNQSIPVIPLQQVASVDEEYDTRGRISRTTDAPMKCNKFAQTDFRESEAQTDPWSNDVIAVQGVDLLRLGWLHLDPCKPMGKSELNLLERHWQKHAWEVTAPQTRLMGAMQRSALTKAMAENDTAALEALVDIDHARRLRLSTHHLNKTLNNCQKILQDRLQRFASLLKDNRSETLAYLKHQLCRNIRKLSMKHRGVEMKYKSRFSRDILTELVDKTSEINAPPLRFGGDPKKLRRPPQIGCQYFSQLRSLEILEKKMEESPKASREFNVDLFSKPRKQSCKRIVSRAERELNLNTPFQAVDVSTQELVPTIPALMNPRHPYYVETPTEAEVWDWLQEQELHLTLTKTIMGRATQKILSEQARTSGSDLST